MREDCELVMPRCYSLRSSSCLLALGTSLHPSLSVSFA